MTPGTATSCGEHRGRARHRTCACACTIPRRLESHACGLARGLGPHAAAEVDSDQLAVTESLDHAERVHGPPRLDDRHVVGRGQNLIAGVGIRHAAEPVRASQREYLAELIYIWRGSFVAWACHETTASSVRMCPGS
jgi:hypothetical protein